MQRVKYPSTRLRYVRRRRRTIFICVALCVCALAWWGLVSLVSSQPFKINDISVNDVHQVNKEDIMISVNKNLQGSVLWFFPRRTVLTYPKTTIEETLLSTFPEIRSVSLSIEKNILHVTVVEHEAVALACDRADGPCFLVAPSGLLFDTSTQTTLEGKTLYIKEGNNVGSQVLPKEDFERLERSLTSLREIGLSIVSVSLTSQSDITIQTIETIIIAHLPDITQLAERLNLVFEQQALTKETLHTIEYIDARFGNKVFFKPKSP